MSSHVHQSKLSSCHSMKKFAFYFVKKSYHAGEWKEAQYNYWSDSKNLGHHVLAWYLCQVCPWGFASLTILSSYYSLGNKLPWHLLHRFPLSVRTFCYSPIIWCPAQSLQKITWSPLTMLLFKEGSALDPREQHQIYSCCGYSLLTKILTL